MTVGITLNNGHEAVLLADSQVTSGYAKRQSNSANKMGEYSRKEYNGVMCGAGSGNILESILLNLRTFQQENLDEFVKAVKGRIYSGLFELEKEAIAKAGEELDAKADIIKDPAMKADFTAKQLQKIMERVEQVRQGQSSSWNTELVIVSYDSLQKKCRTFVVGPCYACENFMHSYETGSGQDAANMYFSANMHGIDNTKLTREQMLLFVLNAYAHATLNAGVGGTPKVAIVTPGTNILLPREKTTILTNLSGAYLSETPGLDYSKMQEAITQALDGKIDTSSLAKLLGVNRQTLQELNIPYSAWQERSNRRKSQ